MSSPYKNCPVYETRNFILRLISESDAEDLLVCYSDPKAQELFNIDNFSHDCTFSTVNELSNCIEFWLEEYSKEAYVRFCIVDKSLCKAIGTIEMFNMNDKQEPDIGILRVDIASNYENNFFLRELLAVCIEHFYSLFNVCNIITKAIPQASERIKALQEAGFHLAEIDNRENYYIR